MKLYSSILYRLLDRDVDRLHFNDEDNVEDSEEDATYDFMINPYCAIPQFKETYEYKQYKQWKRLLARTKNADFLSQMVYIFVLCYALRMNTCPTVKTKYTALAKAFWSFFYSTHSGNCLGNEVLRFVQQAQRHYFAFAKFARIFRMRRTNVHIDFDLYMNPLSPTSRNTFVLLDNDKIYYFSLADLSHLLTEALTYSHLFCSEPLTVKNPYNNLPFNVSTLYNIYFQMMSAMFVIPKFIRRYFECGFNIYLFKKHNESELREHIVRQYVVKTDPTIIVPDIIHMLKRFDMRTHLYIDPEFPQNVLVDAMKPYITLYYLMKYTSDHIRRHQYTNDLRAHLKKFIELNPGFGRRISPSTPNASRKLANSFMVDFVRPKNVSGITLAPTHIYNDNLYNRFVYYGGFESDTDVWQSGGDSQNEEGDSQNEEGDSQNGGDSQNEEGDSQGGDDSQGGGESESDNDSQTILEESASESINEMLMNSASSEEESESRCLTEESSSSPLPLPTPIPAEDSGSGSDSGSDTSSTDEEWFLTERYTNTENEYDSGSDDE